MVTVTLARDGGPTAEIDLLGESGNLAISRDIGKPNLSVHEVGAENPRTQDYQNATDIWTLAGTYLGADAYSDALTLAEEIIKPRLDAPLTLDLTAAGRETHSVVPAGDSALTLTYVPGQLDVVGVQLSLSQVTTAYGGTQQASTPGAAGSGDGIELANPTTGAAVTLSVDTALTRTVGRPGIQLNPTSQRLPIGVDQNAPAADVFELSGVLLDSADADARTLAEDVIRPRLGNESLTVDYRGRYGLGSYDVVPSGSQAARTVSSTAETGVVEVPKVELRAVQSDG